MQITTNALAELSAHEIVQIFSEISNSGTPIIIPVAFPNAGKSMFLSSLMYAGTYHGNEAGFHLNILDQDFYLTGSGTAFSMIKAFEAKKAYRRNIAGNLDIIGTRLEPNNSNRNAQDFAFIDLSGEDIKRVITDNPDGGHATYADPKFQAILNGCANGNTIFCLVTPYMPLDGDAAENELHGRFINYIENNYPNLYHNAKFIVVVAQWDKVPINSSITPSGYIENNRRLLYNKLVSKNTKVVYTEYSIGYVINAKDQENNDVVYISTINTEHPKKLWNHFYKQITGKDINYVTWWDKILIFLGSKEGQ